MFGRNRITDQSDHIGGDDVWHLGRYSAQKDHCPAGLSKNWCKSFWIQITASSPETKQMKNQETKNQIIIKRDLFIEFIAHKGIQYSSVKS